MSFYVFLEPEGWWEGRQKKMKSNGQILLSGVIFALYILYFVVSFWHVS